MKADFNPEGHDESFRGLPFILNTSSFPVPLLTPAPVEPVAVAAASAPGAVVPITARPSGGVERWRPLVQSIFPEREVENALGIMECESHGHPDAHATNGENSWGLLQINTGWTGSHGPEGWLSWYNAVYGASLVPEDLLDPATNLRVGAAVLAYRGHWGGGSGWRRCAAGLGLP